MSNKKIVMSRDVRWTNKLYGKWSNDGDIDDDDVRKNGVTKEQIEDSTAAYDTTAGT